MYHSTILKNDPKGIIVRSFIPEDKNIKNRASYTVKSVEGKAVFNITAHDTIALRTVLNSITKMLTVIEKMDNLK